MLDPSLPYGEVHGATNGVKYYQHDGHTGRHYNNEGLEIDFRTGDIIEPKPKPVAAMPKPGKKKPAPIDDEGDGEGAEDPDKGAGDVVAKNGVNLSAWARGETPEVKINKVKVAIEDVFGRKPKDATEALAIMRGEEVE